MAWPSCMPKAAPAMVRIIASRAPTCLAASPAASPSSPRDSPISRIWWVRASERARVAASATGAQTSFHTGMVWVTQASRLQASRPPGAGMNSVAVSNQRSATVRAWRTACACAAVTVGSPPSRACWSARSRPIVQLTGSDEEAANIWDSCARMAMACPGLMRPSSSIPPIEASCSGSMPEDRRAATASCAVWGPRIAERSSSRVSKGSSLMGFLPGGGWLASGACRDGGPQIGEPAGTG